MESGFYFLNYIIFQIAQTTTCFFRPSIELTLEKIFSPHLHCGLEWQMRIHIALLDMTSNQYASHSLTQSLGRNGTNMGLSSKIR